jgi:hypothetical protein
MAVRHCSPSRCVKSSAKLRTGTLASDDGRAALRENLRARNRRCIAVAVEIALYAKPFRVIAAIARVWAAVRLELVDDAIRREA